MKKFVFIIFIMFSFINCDVTNDASIKVKNASCFDISNVNIGDINFGNLSPGEATSYESIPLDGDYSLSSDSITINDSYSSLDWAEDYVLYIQSFYYTIEKED